MSKPRADQAMLLLIDEIRATLPIDSPASSLCHGQCKGCSIKLLEYIDSELSHWEQEIDNHNPPNLGQISKLGKTARKIYHALMKNGVIAPTTLHQ
ncbi:hypothetical protein SIN8267_02902 [Sinobacterium norvegicum]|uniref:Oxidoreductase-like domain-containing protein n=1 Tax=Sinobacterium norvegicum TaxID=1641715 RepID=A0ABN8EK47_9GAMM|nr:hypothetical protein [Sinobacterium norvegicum]CAH0992765.1 hypothetical protein SIN8267_02902 [Sinobacterium norvegicum]